MTAFRIGFNTKADGTLFDCDEWSFFLDDLRDRFVRPGGKIVLKMIAQKDRVGLKFGDAPLMDLFASRGARFDMAKRYVYFSLLR